MTTWIILSAVSVVVGIIVACYRGRSRWDPFGWPVFEYDTFGIFVAVAGLLSCMLWATAVIARGL